MDGQVKRWRELETGPGKWTEAYNENAKAPLRLRVETQAGSVVEFTLDYGYAAAVTNRGDISAFLMEEI